jgi:diketogulonate reductase-like aldo/keto reductase
MLRRSKDRFSPNALLMMRHPRMIDSSPMYGSSQGTVGRGLAKLGYPSVFAADKVWTPAGGDGRKQIGDSRRK